MLLLSLLLLSLPQSGADTAPQTRWEFPEDQLEITLPKGFVVGAEQAPPGGMMLHRWATTIGAYRVDFSLVVVPRAQWGLQDPFDVMENLAYNRQAEPGGESFRFEEEMIFEGPFGAMPFASVATAAKWNVTERIGTEFFLGGLTADKGYSIRLQCQPAADKPTRAAILKFFREGVVYVGEVENPLWTKEEALARWEKDRPRAFGGELKIVRTKHYIIFTNSSSDKLFAKKMEEYYDAIQATFPFPEVKGRKLMPVFLFRTGEEYFEYYATIAQISKQVAAKSKGHAWRDYYATYYDSPVDPVHIHEATHQIFSNRLKLGGGGSWFQEGVAEYMSTQPNERKGYARNAAKHAGQTPFQEFVLIPSLLQSAGKSATGEDMAQNHYLQAASIIDFARNSKFGKKKFDDFLQTMGSQRFADLDTIEAAMQRVYGIDLAGFEAEWVKYWD